MEQRAKQCRNGLVAELEAFWSRFPQFEEAMQDRKVLLTVLWSCKVCRVSSRPDFHCRACMLQGRKSCLAGVEFSSSTILRLGVALLGVRITLNQFAELGIGPIITVVLGIILTITMGAVLARMLGLSREMGLLTSGSIAICGASAALALSAVMPRSDIVCP
jgi:hypothetical protein